MIGIHRPREKWNEEKDCHVQLLCGVLIWPEEPQLVDLVGFAEMCGHDPVPFSDLTSKQSDVGHHSSIVVKIGVKHEGFEWVIDTSCRSEDTVMKKSLTSMFQTCFGEKWNQINFLTLEFCPRLLGELFQHLFQVWQKSEKRLDCKLRTFLR